MDAVEASSDTSSGHLKQRIFTCPVYVLAKWEFLN